MAISRDFIVFPSLPPSLPPDPDDVATDLSNSKAVVVDVSAPQAIVEAFLVEFSTAAMETREIPFILVASNCGINDRKKELALRILEQTVPTMISGRLGDIYALGQAVVEKSELCVGLCEVIRVCAYHPTAL